jgi:hypothetical protein
MSPADNARADFCIDLNSPLPPGTFCATMMPPMAINRKTVLDK